MKRRVSPWARRSRRLGEDRGESSSECGLEDGTVCECKRDWCGLVSLEMDGVCGVVGFLDAEARTW